MSTRKTEAHELAARARRLGWKVTRSSAQGGSYRIQCPDDYIVQVHMTPSDVNGHVNAKRVLDAHGLAEAEKEWEKQREADKQAAIVADREKAERKAEAMAKRTSAIARAAGPYAVPEPIDLEWALAKHPAPWMKWVIVGPDEAEKILERNSDNRPLSETTFTYYARVLLSDLWRLTHQGIAMDQNGVLQDGQHRLHGIVRSGIPAAIPFFVGMDPENFKAIDEGRLRSGADLIGKDGESHAVTVQGAVRLLVAYRDPNPRRAARMKVPNAVVYDTFQNERADLREAVAWARKNYQKARIMATALAASRFLLYEKNGADNAYVTAFFRGLATGLKGNTRIALDEDDPRLSLKRWMENRRSRGMRYKSLDAMALIVQTWNYVADNYRPRYLRWADDMPIPEIRLCADRGPLRSDCPPLLAGEIVAEGEE